MVSLIQDFPCPRCHKSFSRKYILDNHLKRKKQCELSEKKTRPVIELGSESPRNTVHKDLYVCDQCDRSFTYKNNLYRHKKHYCITGDPVATKQNQTVTASTTATYHPSHQLPPQQHQPPTHPHQPHQPYAIRVSSRPSIVGSSDHKPDDEITFLRKKIQELERAQEEFKHIQHKQESKITELKETQRQNVLNVVCIGSNENYLDMLSNEMGNFDQALEYVKECALSSLSGDCKLIQKIYKSSDRYPFSYMDKSGQMISFLDENKHHIIDSHGTKLGKKLAHNLQNSKTVI